MNDNILRKVLGLLLSELTGPTSVAAISLIESCPTIYDGSDLVAYLNNSRKLKVEVTQQHLNKAIDSLELHQSLGITVIPYGSDEYPVSLELIDKPPTVIYYRGNTDLLKDLPGVAVVGSRQITSNGSEITRRITNTLVEKDFVIVSGLAIGVDSAAHRATIQAKGKTIAVLANGLDKALPKQNERLGAEILEAGGAWVSEYPVGVRPMKHFFVQRNRIQVGLSAGSVIVEATLNSGTMTQADFCNKNSRPLFAVVPHVPSNPLGLECEGTNELVMTNRAHPLRSKLDYDKLIDVVGHSKSELLMRQRSHKLL